MKIKIDIVNDKFCKMSPLAFGATFANLNEYTKDETAEKTFANIGVYKGKTIYDYENVEYKIVNLESVDENTYKVILRKMN